MKVPITLKVEVKTENQLPVAQNPYLKHNKIIAN